MRNVAVGLASPPTNQPASQPAVPCLQNHPSITHPPWATLSSQPCQKVSNLQTPLSAFQSADESEASLWWSCRGRHVQYALRTSKTSHRCRARPWHARVHYEGPDSGSWKLNCVVGVCFDFRLRIAELLGWASPHSSTQDACQLIYLPVDRHGCVCVLELWVSSKFTPAVEGENKLSEDPNAVLLSSSSALSAPLHHDKR